MMERLHRAARKGRAARVKVLLADGAEVDVADYDGVTALHVKVDSVIRARNA